MAKGKMMKSQTWDDEITRDDEMEQPQQALAGQVALVTGGSRGLGRAYAQALAGAGAAVAVTARSEQGLAETVRQIEAAGGQAMAVRMDVTDAAMIARVVGEVQQQWGPLDLLVNNAGVLSPAGPDWEVDPERWWRTFEVNVRGPFLCSQAVLPGMIARRRGRIINVSSGAANSYMAHATGYSASKAAVTNWAGGLAAAAKEHGIAVFAWDPGFVRTAMSEYLAQSDEVRQWFGDTFQQWFEAGRDIPIERSAGQFMLLASGRLDGLSGRQLGVEQDLLDLANRVAEIERDDLLTLRLRT